MLLSARERKLKSFHLKTGLIFLVRLKQNFLPLSCYALTSVLFLQQCCYALHLSRERRLNILLTGCSPSSWCRPSVPPHDFWATWCGFGTHKTEFVSSSLPPSPFAKSIVTSEATEIFEISRPLPLSMGRCRITKGCELLAPFHMYF